MIRRPPRSTLTDTLCPYPTLFRSERGGIPAPAMVEFVRVASNQRFGLRAEAEDMLAKCERRGCATLAFTHDHARIANEAEPLYGSGNGNGDRKSTRLNSSH